MQVLVVGGAGYIGSHVVRDLLDRDHGVTVFDNLSTGLEENLFPEAHFVLGDFLADGDMDRLLDSACFDAVIHLAALKAAGDSMVDPEIYAAHNICGSIHLLNKITAAGIKYFLFSSSAAVYGDPVYLPVDERHPLEPTNFYGFSKLQFERQLVWFSRLRGIRHVCLRYFNAAGYDPEGRIRGLEQDPKNLIPLVMETAVGSRDVLQIFGDDYETRDGTALRDYIHVSDLATAHSTALDFMVRTGEDLTVNLGSETGYTVREVVALAREITGRDIPCRVVARRPGDATALVASAAMSREKLDFHPRISDLATILQTTWRAYGGRPG